LQASCAKVKATRERTIKELNSLGFETLPSSANFVFTKHKQHQAAELFQSLRERKIIVRHFDKPRIRNFLRISIGTDDEMDVLVAELAQLTR